MEETHPLPQTLWQARCYAKLRHGDQRYGAFPYVHHLDETRNVAFEFGVLNEYILVATLLHDVMEDTDTKFDHVSFYFGSQVADLVWAVTAVDVVDGKRLNRAQKNKLTYPKIRDCYGAITLKLCDRIANVRSCWSETEKYDDERRTRSRLGMYRAEYPAFRKALRDFQRSEINEAMWNELDRLLNWIP